MSPTMTDIMALQEMKSMKIIAGRKGLTKRVKYVTVMDNAEIVYWMEEQEILLTNGYFLKDYTASQIIEFLHSLIRKKSAGIFIKLGKHMKTIPQEVIDYADQQRYLIIEVPTNKSWTDISEPISRYLNQMQFYFVHQAMEFRDQLMTLSLSGGSVEELCDLAEAGLKKPVAIYRHDLKLIAASNGCRLGMMTTSLKMRMKHRHTLPVEEIIKYEHYSLVQEDRRLYLFPIHHGREELGSILVEAKEDEPLNYSDISKIEQFSILSAFEIAKIIELGRLEKRYYNEFISNLLEGDLVDESSIKEHGLNLGKEVVDQYIVCLFEKRKNVTLERQFELIRDYVNDEGFITKLFYTEKGDHFVFLIPLIKLFLAKDIKKDLKAFIGETRQIVAISGLKSVTSLREGYQEALFAYSCHDIFSSTFIQYEEIGILPLLMNEKNQPNYFFIDAYYHKFITPIVEYDELKLTELMETLVVFVRCNFKIAQTAKELFIHENTLRFRVKRIEELTALDFKKSEDVFQIMLGIYIYFVKQKG